MNFPLLLSGPSQSLGHLSVQSPYTGQIIGVVEQCGQAHIEAALNTANNFFRDKTRWLPLQRRVDILEKTAALMQSKAVELAELAASEGGKPLMDSSVEVQRAIGGVKMCAEHILNHAGDVVPMLEPSAQHSRMAFTQKEPIGVVVAVSAFNHPLNLIVHQVAAAVAAGCPVIVKPADDTPLSCCQFVLLLREAGLPDEWCQVAIPKSLAMATKLVTDERVGFFSFIGSARVGWMLRSKLAPGVRCALEHGGVAPVIVDQSADLGKLIPAVVKGGFYHAGQVCVSVQRLYVPRTLVNDVAVQLVEAANQLVVGDPLDAAVEVGPLIRVAEIDRIDEWINEAIGTGAQLLCGGKRLANNCYTPTILLNPPVDAKISTQEVFGPVICIYSYGDIAEAVAQANSLDVAFQASIFAQDIDKAVSIYHALNASAVMLNDHTAFRQDNMPFAGLKQSGLGVGGIGHTIDDMQIGKMLVIKGVKSI